MTIQFDTDNNIAGIEEIANPLSDSIANLLSRFIDKISQLEVNLSDEDSQEDGQNNKRCMLQAHIDGMQPIAITNQASTLDSAFKGAIDKLKTSLETLNQE